MKTFRFLSVIVFVCAVTIAIAQPINGNNSTGLGSNNGDNLLQYQVSAVAGTSNLYMARQWMLREGTGSDWYTANFVEGISIDASFTTAQTSRTWWKRDPHYEKHSWGSGGNTYMTLNSTGLGIGTMSPDAKLTVNGQVHATEVKVTTTVPTPDYVFATEYNLPALEQVESYIKQHQHLPEVPSAKEMETDGIKVGEMNMLLLKKIEELTLYVIDLKKEVEALKSKK